MKYLMASYQQAAEDERVILLLQIIIYILIDSALSSTHSHSIDAIKSVKHVFIYLEIIIKFEHQAPGTIKSF